MSDVIKVGVVAYDPKVVTIWEGIKEYFAARAIAMDFVLFSNYDAQVDALLDGWIDIAWNTNLAYIKVYRRTRGNCGVLAMRDVDVGFTTKIIAGTKTGIQSLRDLKGKRLALGSRDSVLHDDVCHFRSAAEHDANRQARLRIDHRLERGCKFRRAQA